MDRTPLVRCGGCGDPPDPGRTLRRGRCDRCYDEWVRSRPIGVGASCASCENRRRVQLRYYEVGFRQNTPGGRWIVLCHNCAASADALDPPARSIEGLRMRLVRDRRWGDRRAEAVGRPTLRAEWLERRRGDRRTPPPELLDDELLDSLVIEMEADYEEVSEDQIQEQEEVTGIHRRIDLEAQENREAEAAIAEAVAAALLAAEQPE
jgi:hypothetical protein